MFQPTAGPSNNDLWAQMAALTKRLEVMRTEIRELSDDMYERWKQAEREAGEKP